MPDCAFRRTCAAMKVFSPNPQLDVEDLRTSFQAARKLQIEHFFPDEIAHEIERALEQITWNTVLNEGAKHFDIHPIQIDALGPDKYRLIVDAAKTRGRSQFQYLYKNYPIADASASGNLKNETLKTLLLSMNSPAVLGLLNQITGLNVDFCDMQATKFETGDFLNHHDDAVAGKNRKFAYVYGLSRDWKKDWGGLLEFFDNTGALTDAFVPKFNTLSMFEIPIPHQVSPVTNAAKTPRNSITGWYRRR